jgi:chloride channel 7
MEVMSDNMIFVRPVERVATIYDILRASSHSNYLIVDPTDKGVLYGTIGRNALCILLQQRVFGLPRDETRQHDRVLCNYLDVGEDHEKYLSLVQWSVIEKSYPKYPQVSDIRITDEDREFMVDLRPYCNTAPVTIHEQASVERTYSVFRDLGLRFLPVVNRYNQAVGTITRADLTPDALAEAMLMKGSKKMS